MHGAALGEEEAALTRQQLGWDYAPFEIPQDAYDQFRQAIDRGASLEAEWNQTLGHLPQPSTPPKPPSSSGCCAVSCPRAGTRTCPPTPPKTVALATRKHSQICLGALGPNLPELIGGSADLTHSNYTDIKGEDRLLSGQQP